MKRNHVLIAAAVVVFSTIVWLTLRPSGVPEPSSTSTTQAQFATLPPEMFSGKTRDAYQAAQDVPEVLEEMPCYCGCMEHEGHKNNLFCFADRHAAG